MALSNGAGDFVRNQPFQIDALPLPVLRHLCTFLTWRQHKILRRVCWGMQDFIDNGYGIHAYLPSRNFNLPQISILKLIIERLAGTLGHITDTMIRQAILSLEGKVIRSWEMNEMLPEFNPFPFQKIVRQPWRLRKISLKYVDCQFLLTVLSSCRNLSTFHYETGFHRQLPQGPMAWVVLGTSFQPVSIPLETDNLIEFIARLPQPTFQIDRLTSLSLTLQMVYTSFQSDWANIVLLLLSLSQATPPNLQDFKFTFKPEKYLHFKSRIQIIACIGQFLSGCPRLSKFEYVSESQSDWITWDERVEKFGGDGWLIRMIGPPLNQNVFSSLAQKFGSDLLKQRQMPGILGSKVMMLVPARQIMREAGMALTNLQDVKFRWKCPFETELFQSLLSATPSIRVSNVTDFTRLPLTRGAYFLLLAQIPPQRTNPVYSNMEKFKFRRWTMSNTPPENGNHRPISLSQMLGSMRSLRHLELVSLLPWKQLGDHEHFYVLDEDDDDDDDEDWVEPNESQASNITLEQVGDGDIHFQGLEVLRLLGVKFSMESGGRLVQFTNLKELVLEVVPEGRHDLFGMKSEDLLSLLGSLRRLDKLYVNMIMYPENDAEKSTQETVLQAVGNLKVMHRLTPHHHIGVLPENRFKFMFGFELNVVY